MKKSFSGALVLAFITLTYSYAVGQSKSFSTYTNPVIPGDHSDCTLSKIGNDFYTTGSSFNPTPVIYHSTDLIHWEAIAQPVSAEWSGYGDATQGGCWGGQIVYYNNKYWDFFSRSNTMYFVTATKPEGPWSTPVKMNNPSQLSYGLGYDNSVFMDDDGKWYLIVKNGQANNGIVELGSDGQATGVVYDLNWLNPASSSYPYSWAEGPVMWKHNGYYYYSFARDLSGGQKVMHSQILTASKNAWTTPVDFFNENDPAKSSAIFSKPNHCSAVVMLDDSTYWLMHPLWSRANSNEWYGQGRQGLVNQVHYYGDSVVAEYPINASKTAPKLPSSGIPWMVPKSDFFTSSTLNPEWSFLGYTLSSTYSLTARPGWLRLSPKSSSKANTVIKTDAEHNYSLMTKVDFNAEATTDEAGLRIINGDENLYAKIYSSVGSDGNKIICFSYSTTSYSVQNTTGNVLWLKIVRDNHYLTGFYSTNGESWSQIGSRVYVDKLDKYTTNYNGFSGNRQGPYVQGDNFADFDFYIYRDAYTAFKASCPANQYGTTATLLTDGTGTYLLDSIHTNDWALYAGVEFGSDSYSKTCDSVQFSASSISVDSATVEVWLDSMDTGTKMASCKIANTGTLKTYNTFKAKTIETTGRHDVYLKFIGTETGILLKLKTIVFVPKTDRFSAISFPTSCSEKLILYPNPAEKTITIESSVYFNRFEIYDTKGVLLFSRKEKERKKSATYSLSLNQGTYLVTISNNKVHESAKLIVR
jgi:xylan 1,4-beta-xylosidase